ncbi:hypothetical protein [uncultured Variovorax sp.]|uniref:hypothetical protein n=1 Tax=uncultured Variovorax sp. TaxID=114708 RepID=UPI0025CEB194|nr:hypothetical protein [uncultured Variovorax sp.]
MPKTNLFIRNGVVVTDATDEERETAHTTRFPGVGRRLDGHDPGAISLPERPSHPPEDEVALSGIQFDDGHDPGGGGGSIIRALGPSLNFLPHCGWSTRELSCLRLVLLSDIEPLRRWMLMRVQRRLQVVALLRSRPHIPRLMPRPVFRVDPVFAESDILSARAVIELTECFDVSSGLSVIGGTLQRVLTYRTHPLAVNLTTDLSSMILRRSRVRLEFPQDTGEVMYVINRDYEIIIAARSGHQRDLPHPTLIGGDDPEVLSAGMIFFRDGRIIRIFINASGHFKPNHLSSIEVSVGAFSRLPPDALHAEFPGYQIFQHGGHRMLHGPISLGQCTLYQPFRVIDGPDVRGTVEATSAMTSKAQMQQVLALVKDYARGIVNRMLMGVILQNQATHPVLGLMTNEMRVQVSTLMNRYINGAGANPAQTLGLDKDFRNLVDRLILRLQQLATIV